ncbi:MAG: hypothetical protein ACPIOQ_62725, partial [Promethearchaeia archaeon]
MAVTRHDHDTRAQWAAEGVCRPPYFTAVAGSLSVRVAADNTQAHGSRTQSHAASPLLSRPSNYCDYASVLLRDGQACEANQTSEAQCRWAQRWLAVQRSDLRAQRRDDDQTFGLKFTSGSSLRLVSNF